jgi:hypothetical protein
VPKPKVSQLPASMQEPVPETVPNRLRPGAGYTLGPRQQFAVPPSAVWITAKQVCERYGGRSLMWLWRKLHDDANFPRATYFGRIQFFSVAELEAYELRCAAAPPPPKHRGAPRRQRAEA